MFMVENSQVTKIRFQTYIFLQYVHISHNILHVLHNEVPTFKTTYLLGPLYIYKISFTIENIKKLSYKLKQNRQKCKKPLLT